MSNARKKRKADPEAEQLKVFVDQVFNDQQTFIAQVLDAVAVEQNKQFASVLSITDDDAQLILRTIARIQPASIAQIRDETKLTLSRTIYWVSHLSLARELDSFATANGVYVFSIAQKPLQPLIDRHDEALNHLQGVAKSHPGIARMVNAACESFKNLKGALT